MALDVSTLENDIASGVKDIPLDGSKTVSDEIAKVVATAVDKFLKDFVDKYNSHTHSGVIIAVVGQAVGTPGNSAVPNSTV